MKYYKENDEVYAFELDGSQDYLITNEMVEMTEAEVNAHRNPEKSIQVQIIELESSVTTRNILGALDGDQYAISKVKQVNSDIVILRAKL